MITRLVLDNFRNYDHQELHFTPGANLLLGANGQGKTNILEAVYYMALLRSFRTSQLSLLTRHGSSFFRLYGEFEMLKHTNESLISTLDEVLQIQTDGAKKRQEAEQELRRIEGELKQKLLETRKA